MEKEGYSTSLSQTCCFTGHRPQKLSCGFNEDYPGCRKIKDALIRECVYLIESHGVTRFISGMALGVDQWAAEAVLALKSHYSFLQLCAVLPCRTQAGRWNTAQQHRYQTILQQCDHVVTLRENYSRSCMQERNRYIVQNSGLVLAVWDGSPSGTGGTIQYAIKMGRKVLHIHPNYPEIARFLNE